MGKKNALDGLLGKLDSQLNAEKSNRKPDPTVAIGGGIGSTKENLFKIGANPFNPSMSPTGVHKRRRTTKAGKRGGIFQSDPLQMKAQMRQARQAEILRRHTGNDEEEEVDGDLKDNLDFVNENKFKTMEWTEPDGSKTTLKFDEDGTLVGKETTKSRPDKFSRDLKKAVDRNAVALKDYEESLMLDPVDKALSKSRK